MDKKRTAWIAEQKEIERKRRERQHQQYLEREALREKRKAEQEAYEASIIPYEEEMRLCDQLITYVETLKPKISPNQQQARGKKRRRANNKVIRPSQQQLNHKKLT